METSGFLDYLRIVSEYMVTILNYNVYLGSGITVKPWVVIIFGILLSVMFKFILTALDI